MSVFKCVRISILQYFTWHQQMPDSLLYLRILGVLFLCISISISEAFDITFS